MRISKVHSWIPGYHLWILPPKIIPSKGNGYPPVIAYWIFGTKGESRKMLRLLKAIYHPRNQYLLQLDAESSGHERGELALSIQSEKVFEAFGNVNVVGKSYAVNQMGASALGATLHAAALLLKISTDWDWFITLSASDYPLMTQDDLLHAFTFLPRDLNFVHYTNKTSWIWKERKLSNQIVVDPSLHNQKSSPLFYAVETRETPDAFELFGGSPWVILTRAFMEYCIRGWDNSPRKLLMYFSNVAYPLESYFHTVLCNAADFQNTTVDNDLSVLNRPPNGLVPGEWCIEKGMNRSTETSKQHEELCSTWGNINAIKPGSYGIKLGVLLSELAREGTLRTSPCEQQSESRNITRTM
nr:beta-glucuronosyltransferase glcat14c [Quercus suber]